MPEIDFDTMRVNSIQIHQEVFELLKVAEHIGEDLVLMAVTKEGVGSKVDSADHLRTHPATKSWDGMGRFAKKLYDDEDMWNKLPEHLTVSMDVAFKGQKKRWVKEEAKKELLNCYQQLGGKNLYK